MAVVRAVELRRSIARYANTGVSCLVDPWGRVTLQGGVFTREILTGAVTLEEGRTFFSRWGGFLDGAWPIALLVMVGWVWRHPPRRRADFGPEAAPRR